MATKRFGPGKKHKWEIDAEDHLSNFTEHQKWTLPASKYIAIGLYKPDSALLTGVKKKREAYARFRKLMRRSWRKRLNTVNHYFKEKGLIDQHFLPFIEEACGVKTESDTSPEQQWWHADSRHRSFILFYYIDKILCETYTIYTRPASETIKEGKVLWILIPITSEEETALEKSEISVEKILTTGVGSPGKANEVREKIPRVNIGMTGRKRKKK